MTDLTGVDPLQDLWEEKLGAAKIAWAKLTDDELLRVDGRQARLAGLATDGPRGSDARERASAAADSPTPRAPRVDIRSNPDPRRVAPRTAP